MAVSEQNFILNIHQRVIDHEQTMLDIYPEIRLVLIPILLDLKLEIIRKLKIAQQNKVTHVNVTEEINSLRAVLDLSVKSDEEVRKLWPPGPGGFVGHPMVAVSAGLGEINKLLLARLVDLQSKVEKVEDEIDDD